MDPITSPAFIDAEGKLRIQHRAAFTDTIACFPNTPGILTFEKHSNGISQNQRKYFFGVFVEILQAFFISTGEEVTKADVYDFLKDRFLFREKMCPITHKYIKVPMSMSDNAGSMNMQEFTEKKEAIQRWAITTLNLELPEPDKNWRMFKKGKDA